MIVVLLAATTTTAGGALQVSSSSSTPHVHLCVLLYVASWACCGECYLSSQVFLDDLGLAVSLRPQQATSLFWLGK